MRKQLLTKMLLIAASVFMGTSAWAASTTYVGSMYTYDVVFGTPNAATPTAINVQTDFTTDASEQSQTMLTLSIDGTVLAGNQGGGRTYAFTTAPTTGTVTFKATGKFVGGNYDFFHIQGTKEEGGETASYNIVSSPYALPSGSGSTTVLRIFGENITASYVYTPRSVLYGFEVTIDLDNQKVDYIVTYASKGSSGTVTGLSTVSGSVPVPDGITLKDVTGLNVPRCGSSGANYYDNVAFYSAVPNETLYTATFTANEGAINPTVTIYSDAGRSVEANNGELSDGTTYYYTASLANYYDYQGSFTVSGVNPSVEFTMTQYPSYTIRAVTGGSYVSLATGYAAKDATYGTYIPQAVLYEGQYYVLDDGGNANLDDYYASYTMGTSNETKDINYTLNSAIVAYWECEDLPYVGHKEYNFREDLHGASKGKVVTPYSGTTNGIRTNTTIGGGVYDITIKPNYWGSSSTTYTLQYSTDGDNWATIEAVSFTKDSNAEYVADDVIIPANSYLRLLSPSSTPRHSLDYIIAEKTANLPANEKIVVTAAGYATYVSNYNLDFTSATTKAYKVNVASKGVATLTEVAKVPAKTPVLLYVAGGNGEGENIAVTTDAVDAVTGNDLVAGSGATVATTDGDYTNMILNNVGGNIGFYFAAGQTVAANRAYLHIANTLAPDAAGSRMSMVFDGEATGVDATLVNSEKVNSEVYDLQGRRVAQPTKGLYIVNGKKVIIK